MPLTLHQVLIPSYLQIVESVTKLISKAEAFCADRELPHEEILSARLFADMQPFAYQVKSVAVHSIDAIEGARDGAFAPDMSTPPDSFEGLRQRMIETTGALERVDPEELESFIGQDMVFRIGGRELAFQKDQFLINFSRPNFHFHATTAYDLMRMKGVPIGKVDFLGRPRPLR